MLLPLYGVMTVYEPHTRPAMPSPRMDEISFQFAWMYYAHLSKGVEGLRRLGGLYSSTSVRHRHSRAKGL
jgi:hypothetical protein